MVPKVRTGAITDGIFIMKSCQISNGYSGEVSLVAHNLMAYQKY